MEMRLSGKPRYRYKQGTVKGKFKSERDRKREIKIIKETIVQIAVPET